MRIGLISPERRHHEAVPGDAEALFAASGGNLGNFAFVEALWRHLSPDVVILPWFVSPQLARECCDILVFAAANQLGSHNDLGDFATHLEKIGLPLAAIGLGAQAESLDAPVELPPGTERWARTLARLAPGRAPNIGVRGEYTLRALDKLGLAERAVVTGCPSNFLDDSPDLLARLARVAAKPGVDRLCVAAGSRYVEAAADLEPRLAHFVAATQGGYVVQADLEMVRFARGEGEFGDPAEQQGVRDFIAPGLPPAALEIWRRRYALCFNDAVSWMEAMRNYDFCVGARFHGVMLAVQAGTPGGVIAHDSRTAELCQTQAIPFCDARAMPRDFRPDTLRALFPFDVAHYAATRERLRRAYVDLLRGCGIEPHPQLSAPQAAA
jgi:hypothetical protein